MGEPKALSRGKAFHKRVQEDWKRDAEGDIRPEHTITLLGKTTKSGRQRRGHACRARVRDMQSAALHSRHHSPCWWLLLNRRLR